MRIACEKTIVIAFVRVVTFGDQIEYEKKI